MEIGRYTDKWMDKKMGRMVTPTQIIFGSIPPIAKLGMVSLQQKTFCLRNFISSSH